jgi:hypothetical protein
MKIFQAILAAGLAVLSTGALWGSRLNIRHLG